MCKSITGLPRASLVSQLSAADAAIIVLFAVAGFTGFPGFAKYTDIKTQIATLDHKPVWVVLLFVFDFLLIYRKIRICYFVAWLARLHALLINAVIATTCVIVARLWFPSGMSLLDTVVAVQSGLAAVYLVVQGWVDFQPDLSNLAKLSKEINKAALSIERQYGEKVQRVDVDRVRDLCSKLENDLDDARQQCLLDTAAQGKIGAEKSRIDRILEALKAPLPDVPDALRRAKETS
jgi:hypothetical protein